MNRKTYGMVAACKHCDQDIQWLGRSTSWRDRGGERSCRTYYDRKKGEFVKPPKRQKHSPFICQ